MLTVILLFSTAYIFTFAWFWPTAVALVTGKVDHEPIRERFEFTPQYVAFVIRRMLCCGLGIAVTIMYLLIIRSLCFFISPKI